MSSDTDQYEKAILESIKSLNKDVSFCSEEYMSFASSPAHSEDKKYALDEAVMRRDHQTEKLKTYCLEKRDFDSNEQQAQRDHEREIKIIDHEIARENRLAAEATAKVAATAQEQASQSLDGLLKGLQGDD